ncbi:hypothetical protein GA0074692_4700 [Micromonospora pallida]|uniref:Uncharacterized protein n=1 Tax=Micromonospora pallida TaxID=145854 RepID=A0A1C6T6W7_9ACTN|nr:hypothetical protein [Micromonospora pallida]SCL37531.1 hypothetical protein GA0074692_4700 [Micromonospora pallida]
MSLTPPPDAPAGPGPVRQLSLFGTEAADPSPADLAGLLAGPAEIVRMGGTARLSVVVDAAWRVHVLVAELARRGLTAAWEAIEDRHRVRTSYTSVLAPLALAWLPDGPDRPTDPPVGRDEPVVKRPPATFHLNGRRLRLWLAAAGVVEPSGFRLRLGAADEHCREPVRRALAAVGLPGAFLDAEPDGPAFRISGRRRLARLAELVGDRPPAAPSAEWPPGTT